jgi:hypothetical protein
VLRCIPYVMPWPHLQLRVSLVLGIKQRSVQRRCGWLAQCCLDKREFVLARVAQLLFLFDGQRLHRILLLLLALGCRLVASVICWLFAQSWLVSSSRFILVDRLTRRCV